MPSATNDLVVRGAALLAFACGLAGCSLIVAGEEEDGGVIARFRAAAVSSTGEAMLGIALEEGDDALVLGIAYANAGISIEDASQDGSPLESYCNQIGPGGDIVIAIYAMRMPPVAAASEVTIAMSFPTPLVIGAVAVRGADSGAPFGNTVAAGDETPQLEVSIESSPGDRVLAMFGAQATGFKTVSGVQLWDRAGNTATDQTAGMMTTSPGAEDVTLSAELESAVGWAACAINIRAAPP